ncbi:MAG: hypothetical protein HOP31_01400 [Ignavibacteria bacterium]|nr:hypothetical protein [Ignavibacteria bacterium]
MFANTKFSKKHAPLFMDQYRFDGEKLLSYSFLKPYILNDDSIPKKTLIAIDTFQVPAEDLKTNRYKTYCYDLEASVSLYPEDAIRLARQLNVLISALFDDMNYRTRASSDDK